MIELVDAEWQSLTAEDAYERCSIRYENEGWTVEGVISGAQSCQYAMRLTEAFAIRQFLLFRDLEEPDLWLATDGRGRWGEVNGAHRPDLDGCTDVDLASTPLSRTLPIRRLPLLIGDSALVHVAEIDVETLSIVGRRHTYTRLGDVRWRFSADHEADIDIDFDVDRHGLVIDYPRRFSRLR